MRTRSLALPGVPQRSQALLGTPWRSPGFPGHYYYCYYYHLPLRKHLSESFINQTVSYARARTLSKLEVVVVAEGLDPSWLQRRDSERAGTDWTEGLWLKVSTRNVLRKTQQLSFI